MKARPDLARRDWRRTDGRDVRRCGGARGAAAGEGGDLHDERGEDSARFEFGSAHALLSDPTEPFRGRLVETLSWTDFGWVIVLLVVALAAFVGGGMFFREAVKVQAGGGKKAKGARGPSLTPKGTPRGSPTVTPPASHPPVE